MSRLDADSRLVTHHQITIDTQFRTQKLSEDDKKNCSCRVPTMEELSDYLIPLIGITHSYSSGSLVLSLEDASYYPFDDSLEATHLCLLVNAVDKNGSITVVKNTNTNVRTEVAPQVKSGEGYDMSSFIFISLKGKQRTYDTLITVMPKVSTNIVTMFLNWILFEVSRKNEKDFTCDSNTNIVNSSTGKVVKVLYKPIFDFSGKIDKELFDKINREGLSDVVLVKNEFKSMNAPDIHNAIIPMESTLRIVPNNGATGVVEWVKSVGKFFKEDKHGGYDTIKIKFKEPDSKSPRQVNLKTDDIRLDAIEKTFIKKTMLSGFSSRLKDSYDTIDVEIIEKMANIA
ncbi:hypothetical protein BSU01_01105 [Erwinia billingiae]|nr:hypothetical protein [Erwinia billingiae]